MSNKLPEGLLLKLTQMYWFTSCFWNGHEAVDGLKPPTTEQTLKTLKQSVLTTKAHHKLRAQAETLLKEIVTGEPRSPLLMAGCLLLAGFLN